ncbi:MAG: hypothetical protein KAR20_19035, partial [Candidatus Heimdallarchaeota archaeon]|nr:hypothetical protein [Candidatus Heimdallarchaeota archaeon]
KNPKGLGLPIICTGNCSPGGKFVFNRIMKLAKVIAVFAFIPLFPKKLLPLVALTDTGFQPATGLGGYGYNDWADPTNGYACNDSNSAIADAQGEKQDYSGFGFSVPVGATINGIQVCWRGECTSTSGKIGVKTYNGSSWASTEKEITTTSGDSAKTNYYFGGSTDLWGLSWSVGNINDSFGLYMNFAYRPGTDFAYC